MGGPAVVVRAQVFRPRPRPPPEAGLPAPVLAKLTADLAAAGCPLLAGAAAEGRLAELRRTYEPYAAALSSYLLQPLPPWHQEKPGRDRKSTRLNSSHSQISYAVFCLKKKKKKSYENDSSDADMHLR